MMSIDEATTIIRVSIAFTALAYASIQDLRSREVDDRVWMLSIPPSACLTVVWVALQPVQRLLPTAVSVAVSTAVAVFLNRAGLLGGADGKAILLMAASVPLRPQPAAVMPSTPFPSMSALLNGLTIAACFLLLNLTSNLVRCWRGERLFSGVEGSPWLKFLTMVGGKRVQASEVDWRKYMPLEEGDTVRKLRLAGDVEDVPKPIHVDGVVWATQGVPLIPLMLVGLALTLAAGDPVLALSLRLSKLLRA